MSPHRHIPRSRLDASCHAHAGSRGQADRAAVADAALERGSHDAERNQQTDAPSEQTYAPSARKLNRSAGEAFCLYIEACEAAPRRGTGPDARARVGARPARLVLPRRILQGRQNNLHVLPVASTVDLPSRWYYSGKISDSLALGTDGGVAGSR